MHTVTLVADDALPAGHDFMLLQLPTGRTFGVWRASCLVPRQRTTSVVMMATRAVGLASRASPRNWLANAR